MSSLDRILPFLQPIEDLLVDPAITEVMVNAGGRRVFVERNTDQPFRSDVIPRRHVAWARRHPGQFSRSESASADYR